MPAENDKKTLSDWLGLQWKPDYDQNRVLGRALGIVLQVLAVFAALVAIGLLIAFAISVYNAISPGTGTTGEAIRNIGLALAAIFGAPFLVWRSYVAQKQADTTAAALYNEKINAALADLHAQRQVTITEDGKSIDVWQDDIVRRNGAIDRFEALAHEDPGQAPRIARMLATYLRELSAVYPPKEPPADPTPEDLRSWAEALKRARSDMENAAQTLGRFLKVEGMTPERLAIDLHGANLQGFQLQRARLEGANLSGAHLEGANLSLARLEWANLSLARLEWANLSGAHLEGAVLSWAHLEGANLNWAHLEGAVLRRARLEGADLFEAQLEGADLSRARFDQSTSFSAADTTRAALEEVDLTSMPFSAVQLKSMFGDGSVILPKGIDRPGHWPSGNLDWPDFVNEWTLYKSNPAAYIRPEDR